MQKNQETTQVTQTKKSIVPSAIIMQKDCCSGVIGANGKGKLDEFFLHIGWEHTSQKT